MLKTTVLSQVLTTNGVLITKVFAANEASSIESDDELIKKSGKLLETRKLSKLGNSKSKKLFKFWKLAKSGKKLSKSENSSNFNAKKNGPSFLIPKAKVAFNRLQLIFTKAPILWYFDPKYHIWTETDTSSYAIDGMLSELTSKTCSNGMVIKTNIG